MAEISFEILNLATYKMDCHMERSNRLEKHGNVQINEKLKKKYANKITIKKNNSR